MNHLKHISKAMSDINDSYIQEAEEFYSGNSKLFGRKGKAAAAIFLGACLLAGGIGVALYSAGGHPLGSWFGGEIPSLDTFTIKAYAHGTDKELTAAGAVMDTGSVTDQGEQKGHPLFFYLAGKQIKSVRFSCEKQLLSFRDWTESREEYGLVRNFTIPYGEREEDYDYLTIGWEPEGILEALKDGTTIAALPEELREDRIVMEITFADGKTAVKMIQISLLDDGSFFAIFDDYSIQEGDAFVRRADGASIEEQARQALRQKQKEEEAKQQKEPAVLLDPAAEEAARAYYAETVLEVVSMEVTSSGEEMVVFSVCVTKEGILQDPNRSITVERRDGGWEVTAEGY